MKHGLDVIDINIKDNIEYQELTYGLAPATIGTDG